MSEVDESRQQVTTNDPGVVMVRREGAGMANQILVGSHRLRADEPDPTGTDTGPAPYDLLASALGAYTSMTLTMYADRKQWPIESITVVLRHGKRYTRATARIVRRRRGKSTGSNQRSNSEAR